MASVEKLPSGKYRARITYKTSTGWRQKSFTADTKKAAVLLAAMFVPSTGSGTVGEMIEDYIRVRGAVLSPSTVKGYKSIAKTLRTRYAAFWGLTEVSQASAQAVANSFSPKYARNVMGLVSAAVRFSGGSFPSVSFPRWELNSDFIPREEDIQRIVQEVSGTEMEVPVALGILGLRRSEIVGLSSDDLDGCRLHIHTVKVYGSDNKLHEKGTKTALSDRFIILPDIIAQKITVQGFVTNLTSHAISGRFSRLVKRLGVSMRFHDLRHYFASYCHNVLKLPDAAIQKLGGWAPNSSALRRHYVHSMRDDETARLVASSFSATFSAIK